MLLTRIRDEAYMTLAEYARITSIGSQEGGREICDNSAETAETQDGGFSDDMGTDEEFQRLNAEIGQLRLQTQQLITQHSRLKEFYDTQTATRRQNQKNRVQRLEEEGEDLQSFMNQLAKIRHDVWTQFSEANVQNGESAPTPSPDTNGNA